MSIRSRRSQESVDLECGSPASRDGKEHARRLLARMDSGGLRLWCRWCRAEHVVPWEQVREHAATCTPRDGPNERTNNT